MISVYAYVVLTLAGMFDKDLSGTINVTEFSALWTYVQQWKGVFDRYDKDRSGNIDCAELHSGTYHT